MALKIVSYLLSVNVTVSGEVQGDSVVELATFTFRLSQGNA